MALLQLLGSVVVAKVVPVEALVLQVVPEGPVSVSVLLLVRAAAALEVRALVKRFLKLAAILTPVIKACKAKLTLCGNKSRPRRFAVALLVRSIF